MTKEIIDSLSDEEKQELLRLADEGLTAAFYDDENDVRKRLFARGLLNGRRGKVFHPIGQTIVDYLKETA